MKLLTVKNLAIAGLLVGGYMLYKIRKEKGLTTWNPMKVFGKSTASDDNTIDVEITQEGMPSDV